MAIADAKRPPFEVQDVVAGARHTLVLTGELDMTTAPELEAVLSSCAEGASGLTLDLSKLTFMDSTGIGLMLLAQRLCEGAGVELALIPGPPQVQQVFELTGLVSTLPFQMPVSD